MWVTDSGIVSKTSWCEFWKAASEMLVTLEGIFTSTHPCVWMSFFVAASTSFLVYVTVTWGSAPKNPAVSSVSASSMIELPRSNSTLRTLRSIGSWQGCFSRSIPFNSRTVAVITTSRVMTLPCKVFNWTSRDMAAKGLVDCQKMATGIACVSGFNRVKPKAGLFCPVLTLAPVTTYVKGRLEMYLAKMKYYFTNLDFPEIMKNPLPNYHLYKVTSAEIVIIWPEITASSNLCHTCHTLSRDCPLLSKSFVPVLCSQTIPGCFRKNRGKTPKMDGENHGNLYFLMDDLGGKPTIFGNTHLQSMSKNIQGQPFNKLVQNFEGNTKLIISVCVYLHSGYPPRKLTWNPKKWMVGGCFYDVSPFSKGVVLASKC